MTQVIADSTPTFAKPVHPKAPFSFRRNLMPPLLGIMVFASVLGLLNAQWIVAQVQYRFVKPVPVSNYTISTAAPDPNAADLIIPKIDVKAPVVYDEPSFYEWKVQLALRRGVVHYGTTAVPGQAGNIVVLGHSSGQLWAPGDYKFVFTMLDKLQVGDKMIVDYKGTRYIYQVSDRQIVKPDDISILQPTKKPQLTLVTCTPVGTSKNRLAVIAKQISPKPDTAKPVAPDQIKPITATSIPH
jgi:LPXTG-site transpeptidase (sortase) family protein